jgi:hypothetical protein
VCHLGPSLKHSCSRERSGGDLIPLHSLGTAKNVILVMMFGYAHARYSLARMTPSPDGVDSDGSCHAASRSSANEGKTMTGNLHQAHGRPARE